MKHLLLSALLALGAAGVQAQDVIRIGAPLPITGRKTASLMPHATVKIYEGAPHGLFLTHTERLNKDLLEFAAT